MTQDNGASLRDRALVNGASDESPPKASIPSAKVPLHMDLLDGAKAAADFLGIEAKAVYRLAAAGEIPFVRKGKKMFFLKSALAASFASPITKRAALRLSPKRPVKNGLLIEDIAAIIRLAHPDHSIIAISGMVNRWQGLGAFSVANGQRGRAREFTAQDAWRAAALSEMSRLGIAPTQSVHMLGEFSGGSDALILKSGSSKSKVVLDLSPYVKAIEARSGETERLDPQDESAVGNANSPKQSSENNHD